MHFMKTPDTARYGIFRNLGVCLLAILFSLVLSEFLFRFSIRLNLVDYPFPNLDQSVHRYSENRELVYELKPSFSTRNGFHTTNSHGMRDKEYATEKPHGVFRIAVLGDSIGFGLGLPREQVFDSLLEQRLNERESPRYEILNFSVVGYNSSQEEILLREKVLSFDPDMVIVAVCLNDDTYTDGLGTLTREMSPFSAGSRIHSRLLSFLLDSMEKRFFRGREDTSRIENLFEQLAKLGEKENFEPMALIFPSRFRHIDSYKKVAKHASWRKLIESKGVPVIDFLEPWKQLNKEARKGLYLPGDKVHLSTLGMKEVAGTLFTYLTSEK